MTTWHRPPLRDIFIEVVFLIIGAAAMAAGALGLVFAWEFKVTYFLAVAILLVFSAGVTLTWTSAHILYLARRYRKMTVQRVPRDRIEEIVGAPRDSKLHQGRAVSETQTFYILHSQECLDSGQDLLDCEYSQALANRGIDLGTWGGTLDTPTTVGIYKGRIVPWLYAQTL